MSGYIQLISEKGEILAQQVGNKEQIEYFKEKVWFVKNGLSVKFTQKSDLVHPSGFFTPVNKHDNVVIYSLYSDVDDHIYNPSNEPINNSPLIIIKAKDLESKMIHEIISQESWNAYVKGQYAGTSEY